MSSQQPVTVNRTMVGAIAVGLLVIALGLWASGIEGNADLWTGACLKVGIVMGALWLALPSITRNEELGKASVGFVVGGIVIALLLARTRVSLNVLIPAAIGFAIAMRILRPSIPRRPPRP